MRLEHDLGEVDEPTDRGLDVAPPASLELVAFALRGSVGAAERAVVDLDRVVGRPLQGLHAEAHQHRVAPLGLHPRERLVGLLTAGLRQPRAAIRRQRREIEPLSAELAEQERSLVELVAERSGAHARRPRPQPRLLALTAAADQQPVELGANRVVEL